MNIFLKLSVSDEIIEEYEKNFNKILPIPKDGQVINIDIDKIIQSTGMSVSNIFLMLGALKFEGINIRKGNNDQPK